MALFMLDERNELTTWICALHRTLVADGYDADTIMHKAGFDFSAVTSTSEYISKDVSKRIWNEVELSTENDAYCLRTLPFISDTYLNTLIIMVQSCDSIDGALRLLLKYYRLVDCTSQITVNIGKTAKLCVESKCASIPTPKQDIDLIFGLITKHTPMLLIDQIRPITVSLTRPTPKNSAAYTEYFSCPVLFGQSQNSIEFPMQFSSSVIPGANPEISKHMDEYLSSHLLSLIGGSIEGDVKREIIHLLPEGTPKLCDVATRLNISERTLQRKLQKYDICFTSLLNEVRLYLAKDYLYQPHKSIQEIAYKLGFSEPGNFIRFFKQQTGLTPIAFTKAETS